MTSLSKTDLTNLEAMIDNGDTHPETNYKGTKTGLVGDNPMRFKLIKTIDGGTRLVKVC